jgi:16S rRNA (uracil1498-N3)-methyltransferase
MFVAGASAAVGGQCFLSIITHVFGGVVRIPRIYQPLSLQSGQTVTLDAQATVHLTKVLRLRVGDELVVFNGEGGEYAARVSAVERRAASIEVGAFCAHELESPLPLVLLQGVSRGERMDYTVQKAVELGVTHIVPVLTERTVVNLKGERQQRRCEHWQAVVNSACEQSGRNRVPTVAPVTPFATAVAAADEGLKLVLHHRAQTQLHNLSAPQGVVTLLIGPEGGLSAGEISAAEAAGFMPLRLGPRVLRTETAAVAAMAVLQWQWGDFAAGGERG